jgi:aspartyl-tRNA(Asn)/glutamyl-tRNA(Gln) amidotransferase subunit C
MAITREQVEHVAHLSRLALTDEELDTFAGQLGGILEYMEKLNELDTTGVEPMVHAIEGAQPTRPDRRTGSLERDEALRNAPEAAEGCFKVPRIIE